MEPDGPDWLLTTPRWIAIVYWPVIGQTFQRNCINCWSDTLLTNWDRTILAPFADDIFNFISLNENSYISIQMSLKNVPMESVTNQYARIGLHNGLATNHLLNQRWSSALTHICVTRPWWINFVGELIMRGLLTFGYATWIASIS